MVEWWQEFSYLLTHNEFFRAGFIWGLLVVAGGWFVWSVCYRLYVQWLRMRQFFEPIKRPGRTPVESGPSPASLMFGCLGRIVVAVLVLATVLLVLWWVVLPGR